MLVKLNKGGTFAPATNAYVPYRYCKTNEPIRKIYFQKRIKKFVGIEKGCYICTPLKRESSLKSWWDFKKGLRKIYFPKNFSKSLPDKIKDVLLHPLWETSDGWNLKRLRPLKKAEHVPRHIELTAVLRAILKQK